LVLSKKEINPSIYGRIILGFVFQYVQIFW